MKGYSLLEMMMVLCIIGLLSALMLKEVFGF